MMYTEWRTPIGTVPLGVTAFAVTLGTSRAGLWGLESPHIDLEEAHQFFEGSRLGG